MSDSISDFINALTSAGYSLRGKQVESDDKWHRCYYNDEKNSSGRYRFKIMADGFAIGGFGSDKDPKGFTNWHSRSDRKMSPEEAAEAKKQAAEYKAQKDKVLAKRQDRLARRLEKAYKRLPLATDTKHAYLAKKQIQPHGVRYRRKRDELIIPLYGIDGRIWNVQRITSGGKFKAFFKGARVLGGCYPIGRVEDVSGVIIICEGFATGASIFEATKLPVRVAFNTANLKAVAVALRKKYPDAQIVFAADNDRWTFRPGKTPEGIKPQDIKGEDERWLQWGDEGLLWNPGVEKAQQAAVAIGGAVVIKPEFTGALTWKPTDFNDMMLAEGAQAVRSGLVIPKKVTAEEVPEPLYYGSEPIESGFSGNGVQISSAPPATEIVDWHEKLQYGGGANPKLAKGSFTNLALFLEYHECFAGVYKLNEFQKEIFVVRCPGWRSDMDFRVKRLDDYEINDCAAHVEQFGLTSDINKVMRAINLAAEKAKFNPARDYFDSLEWDGKPRLATWLTYYMGAEEENADYLAFVGRKWLTAAVKRIYEPGCKFDHVLVIEGKQGTGKSTALHELATFGSESYFTDNVKVADIGKDNTIIMLQGSIIVELAELAGFNKKDDEEIKGWITMREDRCRRPYDKIVSYFPRQFVLAATTNNYDYLKDPSGNRRYWPFKAGSLDLAAIKADKTQLWAEAVYLYKSGFYIGPTEEEMKLAAAVQEKRLMVDVWEDDVMNAARMLNGFNGFKTRDVFKELKMEMRERDYRASNRVAGILRTNGYELVAKWIDGRTQKLWVFKE